MSNDLITVTVKLFAAYQETYGQTELTLNFPSQTPVKTVLDCLVKEHPELEKWRDITRFGINFQFVEADTPLQNGDEVVLIPPLVVGKLIPLQIPIAPGFRTPNRYPQQE